MDGVLSDFMSRYRELNETWERTPEGLKSEGWRHFCEGGYFATLDTWPGWNILTQCVDELAVQHGFTVEILTSTGGAEFHEQVARDKQTWCKNHGLTYKVNAVPGRWTKKDWARPDTVLIDDTEDVVQGFRSAGGVAILHRNVDETLTLLHKMLDTQV